MSAKIKAAAWILLLFLLSACSRITVPPPDNTEASLPPATEDVYTAPASTHPPTTADEPKPEPPEQAALRQLLLEIEDALEDAPVQTAEQSGMLRRFPYPFKAMLAISSDCDSTRLDTFEVIHRFLNTFEETPYGTGLGLDISDSFFVYNGSNSEDASGIMTYCQGVDSSTLQSAELIKKYYDCGWIDSLHAFGDFSRWGSTLFTRELAQSAWELLRQADILPTVWIDHGNESNVQNFGAYSSLNASRYQAGDDPQSPYYHTDLTLATNIRYVWYSRHSNVFGQDFPLKVRTLRDGQKVWSFSRYTNEEKKGDILWNWRPSQLDEQITEARLDVLERKGQYCIIGQHLTMFQEKYQPESDDFTALRLLAQRHHEGRILVARTSRLLDYAVANRHTAMQTVQLGEYTVIRLLYIDDPATGEREVTAELAAGLTFYCDNPDYVLIFLGETLLDGSQIQINPPDDTGRASVGILWHAADTTDYTKK